MKGDDFHSRSSTIGCGETLQSKGPLSMSPCQQCGRCACSADVAVVWRIRPGGDGWAGVNAGRWLAFPLEWGRAQASFGARLGCWMAFISGPVAWPCALGDGRFGAAGLDRVGWNGPWRRRAIDLV